jgi:hypothetical protein
MINGGNWLPGHFNSQEFCVYLLLLVGTFFISHPTRAWAETRSFSEWHDVTEKAFTELQAQEDKLLDANSAKTLSWDKSGEQR